MKTATTVRLFACASLLTTVSAFAAGAQSPAFVSHYQGMFGAGDAYTTGPRPSLAYGGRAINRLAATVKDLTGSPAAQACKGFHSVGDCVAAAHISRNLGVSFTSLRENMTGKNGRQLSAAIEYLRPDVDSSLEAAKAQQQTRDDVARA